MNDTKETDPKDAIGSDKLPLDLALDSVNVAMAAAFAEGAMKYGRFNWRVMGARASVYQAALRRHMMAWWNGEDIDPDSGLPHLYKAVACLAILIDAEANGVLVDDRPPSLVGLFEAAKDVEKTIAKMRQRYADKRPRHYTIADEVRRLPVSETLLADTADRRIIKAYTDAKEN